MSERISVKKKPIVYHQAGTYYDIMIDDLIEVIVPTNRGEKTFIASIDEYLNLVDEHGDDIGYSALDVSKWRELPKAP